MAEHWCKEHQTVWFKKGKMKNYAHPVLDENGEPTGKWCNEPEPKADTVAKTPEPGISERPDLLSKEFNTLIMAAKDAWIATKLTNDDPEIKALRKLMCLRFGSPEIRQANPSPLKGETQASQEPVEAEAVKPEGRDPHSLKNLGELFMAIYKDFKITKTQALKAWGYESPEKIKDIAGCYQFIASMEEARREV